MFISLKAVDPEQKLLRMTFLMGEIDMKGFTLIELLVVVLIIGILSAVALPQYRMAVAKSRIAGLIPFGRSLQEAQKLYYLANGSFATDFTLLDVACEVSSQNPTLCNLSKQTMNIKDNYIVATDHRVSNLMLIFFFDGRAKCMVYQGAGEDFANRLCKSISGRDQFTLNEVGGSKYYKLWD